MAYSRNCYRLLDTDLQNDSLIEHKKCLDLQYESKRVDALIENNQGTLNDLYEQSNNIEEQAYQRMRGGKQWKMDFVDLG